MTTDIMVHGISKVTATVQKFRLQPVEGEIKAVGHDFDAIRIVAGDLSFCIVLADGYSAADAIRDMGVSNG